MTLCNGFQGRAATKEEGGQVSCLASLRRGSSLVSLEVKIHSEKLQE